MPLTRQDAEDLLDQLYATAEVLGNEIKPAAASLMIRDLRDYDRPEIEQALARCRSEITGRLTLAAILERMPTANAHLAANEAWSVVLESQDEQATIIWTDEIAKAAGVANPILEAGDKVGARMAFIAAYEREVAASKSEGREVRWWPSLGESKEQRREAIEQGVKDGRLPAPKVEHLLPAPEKPEDEAGSNPENVQAMLQQLRDTLNASNEQAAEQRRQEQAETEQRRAELIAQAEQRMAGGAA
ncbi:hypothetical protein NPJ88_011475 [Halomonas elongata]|uniref:hypothetical protein n=1 Tax=Halomonas elongata TaxID=2746 RepID=UPI00255A86C0|nr:hypothetical protein [Halomonas elongata]MDL4862956.1 hypothetical protein [Halomonas elongata]